MRVGVFYFPTEYGIEIGELASGSPLDGQRPDVGGLSVLEGHREPPVIRGQHEALRDERNA